MKIPILYPKVSTPRSNGEWKFVFSADINDHMPTKKREKRAEHYKRQYQKKKANSQPVMHPLTRQHALNDQLCQ